MKLAERAWQVWPMLTFAAKHRQLLTYEILAQHTGMHAAGYGPILEHIQSYCLDHSLPPLTAIVVNIATGLPSEGFTAAANPPRAFAEVFAHEWAKVPCPTPEQLAEARDRRPSNGIVSSPPAPSSGVV